MRVCVYVCIYYVYVYLHECLLTLTVGLYIMMGEVLVVLCIGGCSCMSLSVCVHMHAIDRQTLNSQHTNF